MKEVRGIRVWGAPGERTLAQAAHCAEHPAAAQVCVMGMWVTACPSHFQHMAHPQPYEVWTALDFAWLEVCDALLRSVLPPFGPFPRGVHRGEAPFVALGILPPDDPTWIQQLLRATPAAPTIPALPTPPTLDPPQGPLSQEHVA